MSEELLNTNDEKKSIPSEIVKNLELEVPHLFDYLVRMTGSISRAKETTEEVLSLMKKVKKEVPYSEIRVALYSLARKLNKSYWNRYTEKLVNNGFTGDKPKEALLKLESLLGKLEGEDREKIILKYRLSFEDSQIAKVMNLPEPLSMDLGSTLEELGVVDPTAIKKIPNHPVPAVTLYQTEALSEVMLSFETKKKGLGILWGVALTAFIALGIGLVYFISK